MRTIGVKWIFKVKSDGRYRARLVALGYRQKIGIDYTNIHAPVLHEISPRVFIIVKMMMKWKARKADIEEAFLDSILDEDIFIQHPQGISLIFCFM